MTTAFTTRFFKWLNATRLLGLLLLIILAAGCATDEGSGGTAPEIVGTYTDDFGGNHVIGSFTWEMDTLLFSYEVINNDGDYLVARNASANAFNPDLYSRMDWTRDAGNDLYFCQIAFAEATAAAAEAVTTADPSNLVSGCGGFSWSRLTPAS